MSFANLLVFVKLKVVTSRIQYLPAIVTLHSKTGLINPAAYFNIVDVFFKVMTFGLSVATVRTSPEIYASAQKYRVHLMIVA